MQIGGSMLDEIFPGKESVQLRLAIRDRLENLILNFQNIFYLLNSPCNLVSLGFLKNSSIFYNNKAETLYEVKTKKILA